MTYLDPVLVETLLNMAESTVLDFKSAQYGFDGDEAARVELVKDIVAFANAWKTADAHIVIGAKDGKGQRAFVTGVEKHLEDHSVQQLVRSKTNVLVVFEYIPTTVDGKSVGIIRIAREQQRPVYLTRRFGALAANTVYIRHGSSTAEASPDDVARMGQAHVATAPPPELKVMAGDDRERRPFEEPYRLESKVLTEAPHNQLLESLQGRRSMAAVAVGRLQPDPEKLAAYRRQRAQLARMALGIENIGPVTLSDVRVVVTIPKVHDLTVADRLPQRPRPAVFDLTDFTDRMLDTGQAVVRELQRSFELTLRLGKIQPAATAWSDPFWLGSNRTRTVPLSVRVFADNLPRPVDASVDLEIVAIKVPEDEFIDPEHE